MVTELTGLQRVSGTEYFGSLRSVSMISMESRCLRINRRGIASVAGVCCTGRKQRSNCSQRWSRHECINADNLGEGLGGEAHFGADRSEERPTSSLIGPPNDNVSGIPDIAGKGLPARGGGLADLAVLINQLRCQHR